MLAEAAEAALLLRSSQRPGPQREPALTTFRLLLTASNRSS
jgi:hypothetical protein